MIFKRAALSLSVIAGLLTMPTMASAYSITATATLNPRAGAGCTPTSNTYTRNFSKRNQCNHQACTGVKNTAMVQLKAQQPSAACRAWVRANGSCTYNC